MCTGMLNSSYLKLKLTHFAFLSKSTAHFACSKISFLWLPILLKFCLANLVKAYSSSSVYLEGTVATYSCNKGNFLIGAETRVCQADRSWSHDPYCIGKQICTLAHMLSISVTSSSDQAVVQIQFGPTSYCLDWNVSQYSLVVTLTDHFSF